VEGDRERGTGNRGWQSAIPALLVVFFAVQLLVPLRHWAYPGNVDWTEEGSHFSWRMMLADKTAALRIRRRSNHGSNAVRSAPVPRPTTRQLAVDPENLREFAAAIKGLVRRGEDTRRSAFSPFVPSTAASRSRWSIRRSTWARSRARCSPSLGSGRSSSRAAKKPGSCRKASGTASGEGACDEANFLNFCLQLANDCDIQI
jgi:hypothetical protein